MHAIELAALEINLDLLGLKPLGQVRPEDLMKVNDEAIVGLVRTIPEASLEEIFTTVLVPISSAEFSAIWENRYDLFKGLVRIKRICPDLFLEELSNLELSAVARSSFTFLLRILEECPPLATKIALAMDMVELKKELVDASYGVDPKDFFLEGFSSLEEQAILLGCFLADFVGTRSYHALSVAMMEEVFAVLFVALGDLENMEESIKTSHQASEMRSFSL